MALWRVDVAGVSNRLVEADSGQDAVAQVANEVLDALDLRAIEAPKAISDLYEGFGKVKRRRFLASMDGLSSPQSRKSGRFARRRLARLVKMDLRMKEWAAGQRQGPPVDPEGLSRMVAHTEIVRIEEAKLRLREWERPLYAGERGSSGYSI